MQKYLHLTLKNSNGFCLKEVASKHHLPELVYLQLKLSLLAVGIKLIPIGYSLCKIFGIAPVNEYHWQYEKNNRCNIPCLLHVY